MMSGFHVPGARLSTSAVSRSRQGSEFAVVGHEKPDIFRSNNIPYDQALQRSVNDMQFDNGPPAGSGYNSSTISQSTKRQQILEWLPHASSVDIERIWNFLSSSMALSVPTNLETTSSEPTITSSTYAMVGDQDQRLGSENCRLSRATQGVLGGVDQPRHWMQSVAAMDQDGIDPQLLYNSKTSSMPSYCATSDQLSMPTHIEAYEAQPPSDSQNSYPMAYTNAPASMAAALLLRQTGNGVNQRISRESVRSSRSYSSTSTDMGMHSGRSSTTSFDSISSRSSRRMPPQTTISSSGTPLSHKSHQRSSSQNSGSNGASKGPYLCNYSNCKKTFTRSSDQSRHESSIHGKEVYTCLLHTCSRACLADCANDLHIHPYQTSAFRPDKMKEHLEKVHGWIRSDGSRLMQRDIPAAFLKCYEHSQRGWTCQCGIFLGSWADDEHAIVAHAETCTGEIQFPLKRLSLEELDKALPSEFLDEDEELYKGYLEDTMAELSQNHHQNMT